MGEPATLEDLINDDPVAPPHVLLVDDEVALRHAFATILRQRHYRVTEAANGREALDVLTEEGCDVVVSDVTISGMGGLDLLQAIREHDLDVPVVILTANPTVETAMRALEYGALRYMAKSCSLDILLDTVAEATKFNGLARLKRTAARYLGTHDMLLSDRAALEGSLTRGLNSLWMAYQPLVDPRTRRIAAYEALVRTREPTLPHPGALFSVAERLERVHEVGRVIRNSIASTISEHSPATDVFINLHPSDIFDDTLLADDSPLTRHASRIILEITERSAMKDGSHVPERIARLRSLGYRIAIDDLGAGYAGLNYFALLSPEVVKLDISLIRDIDREPVKRKIVGSMTALCKDLGMTVVAEGVETTAERDVVVGLGCDLLQGFLFARPAPPFPGVDW